MFRYSALIIPFALSGCAALELAGRADELQNVVDLATDFQDAIDAADTGGSDGGTGGSGGTVPEGVALTSEEELQGRTGSVDYDGYAVLYVPGNTENIVLTAESTVTADFDDNTVDAAFNDWIGARVDDNYNPIGTTGGAARASGNIDFENGAFLLDGGDANFEGDVSGELTYKGDTYGVDGQMDGAIGTQDGGPENVAAVADDETLITVNGEAVDDADFGFQGEIR